MKTQFTALGAFGMFSILACSSAAPPAGSADAGSDDDGPVYRGVYVTRSPGPITQLAFIDDNHVDVTWSDCGQGAACTVTATFRLDTSRLVLTDANGKVTTLDLSGVRTGSSVGGGVLGLQGGSQLSGGQPGSLTQAGGTSLVNSFQAQASSGDCTQLFSGSPTQPNDKTAFDFFLSEGLSPIAAAGIVGNLDQESTDNPDCYQAPGGGGCALTPTEGLGAGIAQWTVGQRWDDGSNDSLSWWAGTQGADMMSLETQLGFIWYELTTFPGYGLGSLQGATTVTDATDAFMSGFERCGQCDDSNRVQYAEDAFNAFQSDAPSSGGEAGACTASWGSCISNGISGTCISTSACASSGGASNPADLCPGPDDIQCCTEAK